MVSQSNVLRGNQKPVGVRVYVRSDIQPLGPVLVLEDRKDRVLDLEYEARAIHWHNAFVNAPCIFIEARAARAQDSHYVGRSVFTLNLLVRVLTGGKTLGGAV